jgi:hypothetical protein
LFQQTPFLVMISRVARFGYRHGRPLAEREQLLFASKAAPEAPELSA